MLQLDIF